MSLERFVAEREPSWTELEAVTARAGTRPERLEPPAVLRLGALYRAATADLALARRRFPGDPVTQRLEALVLRARQAVYADDRPRRASLREFAFDGYWRRVVERPLLLLLATALLFGPMAATLVWGLDDPASAIGIVPGQFSDAAEPGDSGLSALGAGERSAFASEIFTNNIQVSFLAFAGGIALGLGTALALLYNGGFIGALMGLAIGAGSADGLFRLIVPHGVLELSLICVAGCAGLRLGHAIIEPGTRTRAASVQAEARSTAELIVGTIPWFVLAGLVEGFVTPERLPLGWAIAVGVGVALPYWALVVWRGVLVQRRARAFALR